jgi:hypothetical protein
MQRSNKLRLSYESAPRAAAASARFRPAGVKGGILPSGGSTISEVRLLATTFVPRSSQNAL